jgi:hypothetical protein
MNTLKRSLPPGSVSPHLRPKADNSIPDVSQFPIIVGHVGFANRSWVTDQDIIRATVIREPLSRVRSEYRFWRHISKEHHLPHVALARSLPFDAYIRVQLGRGGASLTDYQTKFLGGPLAAQPKKPEDAASAILNRFDVVGVTDDLPDFMRRLFQAIDCDVDPTQIIERVNRNASRGDEDLTPADWAMIAERNQFDQSLYAEAKRRGRASTHVGG